MNRLDGRIHLDFRADEPIYAQIVRQIEALVAEGTLKPGDQLPTVRELAIDLRINFSTVARAYRILDEQRLISTQRGRGTYIWDEDPPGPPPLPVAPPQETAPPHSVEAAEDQAAENRDPSGKLAALAQRFIHEAAELGATAEQIEQVFQQQMAGWKVDHPAPLGKSSGGNSQWQS